MRPASCRGASGQMVVGPMSCYRTSKSMHASNSTCFSAACALSIHTEKPTNSVTSTFPRQVLAAVLVPVLITKPFQECRRSNLIVDAGLGAAVHTRDEPVGQLLPWNNCEEHYADTLPLSFRLPLHGEHFVLYFNSYVKFRICTHFSHTNPSERVQAGWHHKMVFVQILSNSTTAVITTNARKAFPLCAESPNATDPQHGPALVSEIKPNIPTLYKCFGNKQSISFDFALYPFQLEILVAGTAFFVSAYKLNV